MLHIKVCWGGKVDSIFFKKKSAPYRELDQHYLRVQLFKGSHEAVLRKPSLSLKHWQDGPLIWFGMRQFHTQKHFNRAHGSRAEHGVACKSSRFNFHLKGFGKEGCKILCLSLWNTSAGQCQQCWTSQINHLTSERKQFIWSIISVAKAQTSLKTYTFWPRIILCHLVDMGHRFITH